MRTWNVALVIAVLTAGLMIISFSDSATTRSESAASASREIDVVPIDPTDERTNRIFQQTDYGWGRCV